MSSSSQQSVPQNVYYMHIPLFVLDVIRMFQNHPKFNTGLKISDIVDILQQEKFADGDLVSQVESAIRNLEMCGYVRNVNGYRTLGPLAKLATAKTQKERRATWDKIQNRF